MKGYNLQERQTCSGGGCGDGALSLGGGRISRSNQRWSSGHHPYFSYRKLARWRYTQNGTKTFNHCAADVGYNSGIYVVFAIGRSFSWSMGFANPAWHLNVGAEYDIAFSIDGGSPISAKATAIGASQVEVPLEDSTELFDQFRKGHFLKVAAANQVFGFDLAGTSAVLSALLNCVRKELIPVMANPFEPRSQTAAVSHETPSRQVEQAEASIVLANVLSAASLQGFRVGSTDQANKLGADAVWTANNLIGTVRIFDDIQINDPDIRADVIASDAKACKGSFASGALPDTDGTGEVRLFTACGTAGQDLTIYYVAVVRPPKGVSICSLPQLWERRRT